MDQPNEYALLNFKRDENGTLCFQPVIFYEKEEDGSEINGTTLEEMLRVCGERLTNLDNRLHCAENEEAITHIMKARVALEARTKDRIARGVEGKHEA